MLKEIHAIGQNPTIISPFRKWAFENGLQWIEIIPDTNPQELENSINWTEAILFFFLDRNTIESLKGWIPILPRIRNRFLLYIDHKDLYLSLDWLRIQNLGVLFSTDSNEARISLFESHLTNLKKNEEIEKERELKIIELQKSQEILNRLTESILELVGWADRNLRFTFLSASCERILGYKPEELIGRSILENIHPEDLIHVSHDINHLLFASSKDNKLILRYRSKNGNYLWLETRGVLYSDPESKEEMILFSSRDITNWIQTQEELKISEKRYESVINTQEEMVCRFLPDTTLTFVNEAYCRAFQKTSKELLGRKFINFVPRESQDLILNHISNFNPHNSIIHYEHPSIGKDGKIIWQKWTDYAILNEYGEIIEFQSIGQDISDRKNIELLLERTLAERNKKGTLTSMDSTITLLKDSLIQFNPVLIEIQKELFKILSSSLPYQNKRHILLIHSILAQVLSEMKSGI